MAVEVLPRFEIELVGFGSRVLMDGRELNAVTDVKVHQGLDSKPVITISFLAESVTGIKEPK